MDKAAFIKVGAECKTRDGHKAVIYAIDEKFGKFSVVGYIEEGTRRYVAAWTLNGSDNARGAASNSDLISSWVTPVTMDWRVLPANVIYIMQNEQGVWYGYEANNVSWEIPALYAPIWNGDWRHSRTEVPLEHIRFPTLPSRSKEG